jgi:hypothetical protein
MRKCPILASLILVVGGAWAADPPAAKPAPSKPPQSELERLEQLETFEKLKETIRKVEVSLDAMTRERKFKCLKAFGSESFCECLNQKLAVGLDFDAYIAVVTRTKTELKYDTFSKEDKALVDSAIRTRSACVR